MLQVPLLLLTNGRQQVVIAIDYEHRSLRQLAEVPRWNGNNVKI